MYRDDTNLLSAEDVFKQKFKYYKSNKPKPSLKEVLSADNITGDKIIPSSPPKAVEDSRTQLLGLHKLSEWQMFTIANHPGLLLIRNPFTTAGQRYWIRRCLERYPRKPNKMNIDIDMDVADWWSECYRDDVRDKQLQKKLRWTTLGYHHNWDTKVYSEENKSPFPEELAELSDIVAQYLGYTTFKSEAAIVNYYHMDSTLSAHTDHSEINLDAPLFSFSFGQSAIFLIGGKNKTVEPTALLLKSGDIVVMSKEARLCYHAVPKIVPTTDFPWNVQDQNIPQDCDISNLRYLSNQNNIIPTMTKNMDNAEWDRFNKYINISRINMNVRQVLHETQDSIADTNFNRNKMPKLMF